MTLRGDEPNRRLLLTILSAQPLGRRTSTWTTTATTTRRGCELWKSSVCSDDWRRCSRRSSRQKRHSSIKRPHEHTASQPHNRPSPMHQVESTVPLRR